MIDASHDLPVSRQCHLLCLARSTAYYRPREANETELALMRRMDELHLEYPFAGSRMLRDLLKLEGYEVGRKHVATLMKKMGIEALYKKPNTSRAHPGAYGVSVPATRGVHRAGESRVGGRYHLQYAQPA